MGKNILTATFVISFFSLVSRVVGLLRDRILAGQFGASSELDIYYAAFRIPDFLFQILVAGALFSIFIPIFVEYMKKGEKESWYFSQNVMTIFFVFVTISAVILIIFTPFLMSFLAPGFFGKNRLLVISLTRIMFLSPLFLGLSAILSSILQSYRRFFIFSLAPVFYNLGIIFGVVFFVPKFGLIGLAWGVVLGTFLHFAIQIPSVWKLGFRFRWVMDFSHQGLRQMFKLALPRIFGLAVSQINLLVITAIASTLIPGSITIFNFAENLQTVIPGLIAIPLAIAVFPSLSRVSDDKKKFKKILDGTLFQIMFFVVPAVFIFYFFSEIIVKIILGIGRFSVQDVRVTGRTLSMFSFGIIGESLIPLLVRGFYALQDTLTPVLISLFSIILNIVAAFYFIPFFGSQSILALPLAFSISSAVNAFLLYVFLKRRIRLGE